MPNRDTTGPMGAGPMTGRGLGQCAGYAVPSDRPGFGFGRGRGGGGFGQGRWQRGPEPMPPLEPQAAPIPKEAKLQELKAQLESLQESLRNVQESLSVMERDEQ